MAKTDMIRKKAAKDFAEFWKDKGDEKQHTQTFWLSLLRDVLGVTKPEQYIDFEKRVKVKGTKFIDAYIANTNVAIEQKSEKIDLDKKELQSDKSELTPYEQAKRYNDNLRYSERSRWIVVSNFREFRIYDMEKEEPEKHFQTVLLKNLSNDFEILSFLVDSGKDLIPPETQVSLKAGELVGKLYDALIKEYINPDENSFRSLNILCVRIVFCLYAEDAGLFETRTAFEDYIKSFSLENLRRGLMDLFKILNTKPENRDKYDTKINSFPYVNGGLFADDTIEVPNFNKEIVDVLVNHCAPFDWSKISPTIFGAVFESTLNPETRRKGGMHYTSIENIHKVIDPLFLDGLRAEFKKIVETSHGTSQKIKLEQLRNKIASLTFLDPACGSGNFLTETYISLRRLENEILRLIHGKQQLLGSDFSPIKVKISQFYGIEINDFAVTVAKTALWIAESQMMKETEEIVEENLDFLPLSTSATIVEGNALRMDWSTLKSDNESNRFYKIFVGFEPESDGIEHHYDYIMGNPPFVGNNQMGAEQRIDLQPFFPKNKTIDYVACWYVKAADFIKENHVKCAFVSTNSITQGEQVPILWDVLNEYNIQIDFAWKTFKWNSESTEKAAVHCVIVGFSCGASTTLSNRQLRSLSEVEMSEIKRKKRIFTSDGKLIEAKNINGYLLDAPDILIKSRSKPLCDVPKMRKVNQPTDGGNLIIEAADYADFIKKEPSAKKFIKPLVGADEFINNKKRYCLWLVNATPAEIRSMPHVKERIAKCREMRLKSPDPTTQKLADKPHLFRETVNPKTALIIPRVSSENRFYVPIGFIDDSIIFTDAVQSIADATLYHFGVLTSSVHNAWMRAVCGRLKSDYRYSKDIVYNNFPWPDFCRSAGRQAALKPVHASCVRSDIEQTAQAILDARAKYPDSSLADLYDETTMPPELRKAHRENDKAVMAAYGFKSNISEAEIVAELFKMYEKLTK